MGSSPSLVIVDEGMAASISTMTLNKGIYAFFFNQRGLMGGLGLQGSRKSLASTLLADTKAANRNTS